MIPLVSRAFVALLLDGVILGSVALAGAAFARSEATGLRRWIVAPLAVALAGYAVFWCGFLNHTAGRIAAWIIFSGSMALILLRRRETGENLRRSWIVLAGMVAFVFAATALLLLFPDESVTATARNRFIPGLPGDNGLPKVLAEIIDSGNPTRLLGGDWLTSDRPPLQTGIALVGWPMLSMLGIDLDTACAVAGIWFQALWFPVMWQLLRTLGLPWRAALGVTSALAFTAFLAINTVFVWPKLGAGALLVAGWLLWSGREAGKAVPPSAMMLGAACAACGWLAHGGVTFSLIALGPWVIFDAWRRRAWRAWALAAAVFLMLVLPWLLYQRTYSPPGNRLVKWHIGGVIPPDHRTVAEALRDRYREIGWKGAWEARVRNFRALIHGDWIGPYDWRQPVAAHRIDDFYFALRTVSAWGLGIGALPWLLITGCQTLRQRAGVHLLAAGWLVGGIAVWWALMFFPDALVTHQGTYVTQLLLLALLGAWAWLASRAYFALVAVVQWIGFILTWSGPAAANAHADPTALAMAVLAGGSLLALTVTTLIRAEKAPRA